MQNSLPNAVIEELNILNHIASATETMIPSVSTQEAERLMKVVSTYRKMSELLTQFDWKDYVEQTNT